VESVWVVILYPPCGQRLQKSLGRVRFEVCNQGLRLLAYQLLNVKTWHSTLGRAEARSGRKIIEKDREPVQTLTRSWLFLIYSTFRGIEGQERGLLLPAAGLGKIKLHFLQPLLIDSSQATQDDAGLPLHHTQVREARCAGHNGRRPVCGAIV
jgi:hypothetical protein